MPEYDRNTKRWQPFRRELDLLLGPFLGLFFWDTG